MSHVRSAFRLPGTILREYRSAFGAFSREARLFLAGSFLLGVGANQISLLWGLYLKASGYTPGAIGETLSFRALGSALVALPASFLIARVDPRRLLPAAAALAAVAYAAQTLSSAGAAVWASVLLAGGFSTIFQVSAGPFLMRNSGERERVHLFSLNAAFAMGTGLVGSLAGGLVKDGLEALGMAEVAAYRAALLLGAAFVLSSILPFSRLAPSPRTVRTPSGGREADGGRPRADRIGPALWVKLILPGFLVGLGAGLTIPWLNLWFKLEFALGDTAIGAAVAAGQVATFLGMAGSPLLARRIGKARSVFVTQGLSVPLILVLAIVRSLPLALAAYLARQALMNMSTPIQDNFVLELVPPSRQGAVNAMKMLSWTGSWTIAARLSGAIIDARGFGPSFVVTAALYGLSTLLFWLFFI